MSDQDLHRTNLNLYLSDVQWMRNHYGHGWTEWVRDMIHQCIERKRSDTRYIEGMNRAGRQLGDPTDE